MEEPSVLDYVKAKLAFWKHSAIEIPPLEPLPGQDEVALEPVEAPAGQALADEGGLEEAALPEMEETAPQAEVSVTGLLLGMGALLLALVAQGLLEPPNRSAWAAGVLYLFAAVCFGLAYWRGFVAPADVQPVAAASERLTYRREGLLLGIFFMLGAFVAFVSPPGEVARFNFLNTTLWLASIASLAWAFYLPADSSERQARRARLSEWLNQPVWKMPVSRWAMLLVVATGVILFFRFYHLNSLPQEMVSDHAEKLLDVNDVLNGEYRIFFPRNTGREFFQFYWTALMVKLFPVGVSFMALKLGTTLIGLWTLYYMYRLGLEIANRRVALLAVLFTGFSYWAVIQSRIGLRFPLYPGFLAPVLFHLIRGLRRSNRNDFIWAGIWLGLGLHGYTSYRIVPLVVLAIFAIFLLHNRQREQRRFALFGLLILVLVSLAVFMPLLRFTVDHPDMVIFRSMTRLGETERALPGSPLVIFAQNTWNALVMFFWDNGDVWVHSIVHRPAMDVISAALFFLGGVLALLRYFRKRTWTDLTLLVSIPLLLLPSILSLAFPNENPNLNRTAGAYIPAFLLLGLGLDAVLDLLKRSMPARLGLAAASLLAAALIGFSMTRNFDMVFHEYDQSMRESGWNTSEMGVVIREFEQLTGERQNAWVLAYPYWVDTRLVGINAGYPTWDTAINYDQILLLQNDPRAKLFIVNSADQNGLEMLRQIFPQGRFRVYTSRTPGKDFIIYQVPASEDMLPIKPAGS